MEDSGKVVGCWVISEGVVAEMPKVDQFLDEVIEVCKKHGLSITHEDTEGAFIVCPYDEEHSEWLKSAGYSDGKKTSLLSN